MGWPRSGHGSDQPGAVASEGLRIQGDCGTAQRLVRDVVHARTDLLLAGELQRAVHRLARHGQHAGGPHD